MNKLILIVLSFVFVSALRGAEISSDEMRNNYLWPKYTQDTIDAVSTFLEGETFDKWDYGNIHDRVPEKYAKSMRVKHAFFCNSGTSALHASLMAIGLKRGDRVAVPAMTFIRSVTPLIHMGLEPVLVDIDPITGNIDPKALKKINDPKVKAVIVVHMWGVPVKIGEIVEISKDKQWKVLEDFSHAHFSEADGGYVGTIGDIGFASLQRKKTLSVGEGGIIVTNDDEIFDVVRQIVSPGSYHNPVNGMDHSGFGLNMRMAPTAIIIADSLHGHIDNIVATRSGSAEKLIGMMAKYPEIFDVPTVPNHVKKVSWYALRPKTDVSLNVLKAAAKGTRWKFSDLDYPMIASHMFWSKDQSKFPFSDHIRVVNSRENFPGAKKYIEGRISVKVPSLSPEEWTDEEIKNWENDLAEIVRKI